MNFQERIESTIFKGKGKDPYKVFHEICFMLSHEFGWSYEEIVNAPMPFIIAIGNEIDDFNKKQKVSMKKKR